MNASYRHQEIRGEKLAHSPVLDCFFSFYDAERLLAVGLGELVGLSYWQIVHILARWVLRGERRGLGMGLVDV